VNVALLLEREPSEVGRLSDDQAVVDDERIDAVGHDEVVAVNGVLDEHRLRGGREGLKRKSYPSSGKAEEERVRRLDLIPSGRNRSWQDEHSIVGVVAGDERRIAAYERCRMILQHFFWSAVRSVLRARRIVRRLRRECARNRDAKARGQGDCRRRGAAHGIPLV